MKKITLKLTFLDDVLGSLPASDDLYSRFVASKAPDAETMQQEIEARGLEDVQEEKQTVFAKLPDGTPCLYDYHIKGFFKDAWQMLRRCAKDKYTGAKACGESGAYKKEIDGCVFVTEREIPFDLHGMKMDVLERPLRASTPQGERCALAASELVPEGSTIQFTLTVLKPSMWPALKECLDYGIFRGIGQWRNIGKGRFTYEILKEEDVS